MREDCEPGGSDNGAFPDLISLEQEEDKLELRQVVVGPLRTKLVVAKERLSELFCTEIGESCSGQKESVLLGKRHKHEYDSSSWKKRLLRRPDCPELGIHTVVVCD